MELYIVLKNDERYEPRRIDCIHAFSDETKAEKYVTKLNHDSKSVSVYYSIRKVPLD